jgi:hypothetical protein
MKDVMRHDGTGAFRRPATRPDRRAFAVRTWLAEQVGCRADDLRQLRTIELAPGVREVRYVRDGHSEVVATVARQQPGRYRIRAAWGEGTAEGSVRGYLEA